MKKVTCSPNSELKAMAEPSCRAGLGPCPVARGKHFRGGNVIRCCFSPSEVVQDFLSKKIFDYSPAQPITWQGKRAQETLASLFLLRMYESGHPSFCFTLLHSLLFFMYEFDECKQHTSISIKNKLVRKYNCPSLMTGKFYMKHIYKCRRPKQCKYEQTLSSFLNMVKSKQ